MRQLWRFALLTIIVCVVLSAIYVYAGLSESHPPPSLFPEVTAKQMHFASNSDARSHEVAKPRFVASRHQAESMAMKRDPVGKQAVQGILPPHQIPTRAPDRETATRAAAATAQTATASSPSNAQEHLKVFQICRSAMQAASVQGATPATTSLWSQLTEDDVVVQPLLAGYSSLGTFKIQILQGQVKRAQPREVVLRLHNRDMEMYESGAALAASRGAGPLVYYHNGSHSACATLTARQCKGFGVYAFGGTHVPQDFLYGGWHTATRFGELVARLHGVERSAAHMGLQVSSQEYRTIGSICSLKLARTTARLSALGLSAVEVAHATKTLGAYLLNLLNSADFCLEALRQVLQTVICEFAREGGWLSRSLTSAIVVGHADLMHTNIVSSGGRMLAIDFEAATLIPACVDLGTILMTDRSSGATESTYLSVESRVAIVKAYCPRCVQEDGLWDMEVGVLFRFTHITMIIAQVREVLARSFLRHLRRMIHVMRTASRSTEVRRKVANMGILRYTYLKATQEDPRHAKQLEGMFQKMIVLRSGVRQK